MRTYFDTSAMVKGYLREEGTDQVLELIESSDSMGACVICLPELISALCRHVREGKLTRQQYKDVRGAFLDDMADADIVQLTGAVVDRSMQLLEQLPLRAADALHISSAIEWKADRFVSSDHQQLDVASKAGLECVEV